MHRIMRRIKKIHKLIFGEMPLEDFEDYDAYWVRRKNDTSILHRFISIGKQIPQGDSVVDIGCGNGKFLQYIKTINPTAKLHGLDTSEEAVRQTINRGIHGTVIPPGVALRELVAGSVDHVVMMELIEHVCEAESLVMDALSLNPKSLFITIPNSGYIMHRLRLMFGGRFPVTFILFHMKEHVRFWTVKDFFQWADHLGLDVIHYEGQQRTKKRLRLALVRVCPHLFACSMIYHLKPRN